MYAATDRHLPVESSRRKQSKGSTLRFEPEAFGLLINFDMHLSILLNYLY